MTPRPHDARPVTTDTDQHGPDRNKVVQLIGPARRPPVAVPVLLIAAFSALLTGVLTASPVRSADLQVRAWVLTHQNARVAGLSTSITVAAAPSTSVTLLLLFAGVLSWRQRSAVPFALAALAIGALTTTVLGIKVLVGRAGPALRHGHIVTGYFPSGHTTSAFVCFGLMALLLTRRAPDWRYGPAFRVGLAVAAVVGAAMVYSNFHWLSDVLAGWALGGTLVWMAVAVAPRLAGSSRHVVQPTLNILQ